ncbi:hypothetical protein [Streptomyces poonensis]|uniref:Zinc-finger domain-containing protein n=1 Tax=Streptomyces poonensis TaxID=68255 RepID=A0A918PEV8_9ACTN|nr:hypothetical protein [Streptomyces poonensis]GGZ03639.1 hypothetical protein GCM10010365_23150 [Streptomyces poonensis]GLJ90754.1 hypothetical protein GCM10017589_33590 [Streptomyces poonensis]
MECEQVKVDLAAEALTGEAEPEGEARLAHLDGCGRCRREHEEMRGLARLLAATTTPYEPDVPAAPDPR